MSHRLIYRCRPSIVWIRDAGQTLIVDRERERTWALHGAEAVVWDLLTVGYSYQGIIPMLSSILSLPAEKTAQTLASVLRKWQDASIVQVSEEAEDGQLDRECSM